MNPSTFDFHPLLSDEVFVAGISSSDARSLWRSLARTEAVRSVSRQLASDPDKIRQLCAFVRELLEAPADVGYMHPHNMAICAGLVLLEQSPLSVARNLFARLRGLTQPSLFWVQHMADYCEQRFADLTHSQFAVLVGERPPLLVSGRPPDNVVWADPKLERDRLPLHVA